MNAKYEVTIEFTGGTLNGLTHTRTTNVPVKVGTVVRKPYGGTSPYKVISCVRVYS